MDLKAEKLATEAKNFEKQQKEIAKLEDFVNRNIVRASTTKRAQARRKQLEKIERLDKPTEGQKSANMTFHVDKVSGNVVLTVRNAAIGYDNEILSSLFLWMLKNGCYRHCGSKWSRENDLY